MSLTVAGKRVMCLLLTNLLLLLVFVVDVLIATDVVATCLVAIYMLFVAA